MENDILFYEKQKFTQWWIWVIILGINGIMMYGIYYQVICGKPFGNHPMDNIGLLLMAIPMLLILVLFYVMKLETKIKSDGIYVRFFPFHIKFKHYPWQTISKAYVRTYSPIAEYGGWGLRLGLFGKGMAYNVSGNVGVQLEFANNKKLLIGTHKPDEITIAIEENFKNSK
ncbi:MAG: hypothetical protein K1X91_09905 [Bacteriodetes bacterium]|nr:hypothetical protein [Bacteroidota bacterium]